MRDDYVVSTVQTLIRASKMSPRDDRRYSARMLEALTWHLVRIVDDGNAEPVHLAQLQVDQGRSRQAPDLDAVLSHIDMRLGDPLPLRELADVAGVGRTQFALAFAEQLGCTPHRFIVRRRIERARQLLRLQTVAVSVIAYELGFSSPSHFAAKFKSETGIEPSRFAETEVSDYER